MSRKYPSYNIKQNSKKEWYWTYEASNGKTIARSSEGYVAKRDCERSVEILKESSSSLVFYEE